MAAKRIDGIETKKKLLKAACEVFAETSFHDAKIADICKRAGTNVAAVNYYFNSKDNLYKEAWSHNFEESIAAHPPNGNIPTNAPAEERLRGQISSLLRRIMDPANLEFDIAHREMANPTGLLSEVMKRSLDPLRKIFTATIREILGPAADETHVQLCEISVHTQCFGLLMRIRHRNKPRIPLPPGHDKHHRPPFLDVDINTLTEHVIRFSLAGLKATKDIFFITTNDQNNTGDKQL